MQRQTYYEHVLRATDITKTCQENPIDTGTEQTRVKSGALTSSCLLANTSDKSTSVVPTCTARALLQHEHGHSVEKVGRVLLCKLSRACSSSTIMAPCFAIMLSTAGSIVIKAQEQFSNWNMEAVVQMSQENDTAYPVVMESVSIHDLDHELGR